MAGVAICFYNNPGWSIRDAEVENFTGGDEIVERIHQLWYGHCRVPEVDVILVSKSAVVLPSER